MIDSHSEGRGECIGWWGIFPNMEEYDSVVIDLQSLFQSNFDDLCRNEEEWRKIEVANRELQTLLNTGREIFCILNEILIPSHRSGEPKAFVGKPRTNFDILPGYPKIWKKEGTTKEVIEKRFEPYMDEVEKWNYELGGPSLIPIAENRSKKLIAATLPFNAGKIHFLPPPTKCTREEAINILLDIIHQPSKPTHPRWRMQLQIPRMQEVHNKIGAVQNDIKNLNRQLDDLRKEQARLDRFRDLVSPAGTGEYLESIVKDVLLDLGIKTSRAPKGFPVDLLGDGFAFEVTGVSKGINVSSEKYNQTLRFLEGPRKNEKIVLVANTYKNKRPSERLVNHFGKEVSKHLENRGVCLMTTLKLYSIWRDVLEGKKDRETAVKLLKETNGELK